MQAKQQIKAKKSETIRTETLTFRLNKRLRSLGEIAAKTKGIKLSNYVEGLVEASLSDVVVQFDNNSEPNYGTNSPANIATLESRMIGRPLLEMVHELYDDDDSECFFKRLYHHSWAMDHEQTRLWHLIQTSPHLNPKPGVYKTELIRQHWNALSALVDGSGDVSSLPSKMFEGVDIEFALMSEAQRIALYRADAEEFTRRSQAHLKSTRRK